MGSRGTGPPTGGLGPGDALHHAMTRTLSQNAACFALSAYSGNLVCIDSTHERDERQLYVIDVRGGVGSEADCR